MLMVDAAACIHCVQLESKPVNTFSASSVILLIPQVPVGCLLWCWFMAQYG